MILDFDKLEFGPFKAYETKQVLDMHRMGVGVWFVRGKNGAGKSTAFDALCWCLYGRDAKGGRNPDVTPWHVDEYPWARVTLGIGPSDGDMHECVIERSGKTNGLKMDGKVCQQDAVNALLGLSYESFMQTILLGQTNQLFFDISATKKLEVLTDVLMLNKWDDRIDYARKQVRQLESEATDCNARCDELDLRLNRDETKLNEYERRRKTWAKDRADIAAEDGDRLAKMRKDLEAAEKEWGEAELAYEAAETELRASQRKADDLEAERTKLAATAVGEATVVDDLVEKIKAKGKAIKNLTDTCPECGQLFRDAKARKAHRAKLVDERDLLIEDEEGAQMVLAKSTDKLNANGAALIKVRAGIRDYRKASDDAVDKRDYRNKQVQQLKAEIKALEIVMAERAEETNPYTKMVRDLQATIKNDTKDFESYELKLKSTNERKERVQFWVDGFKQVRLYLVEDLLAELEGVTQTMLGEVGLEDWRIEYRIDKDTKKGTTLSGLNVAVFPPRMDIGIKWELFSGGEMQRLRLIGAVALSQVLLGRAGIITDLMIFDEPTKHLDPEGVGQTVDYLCQLGDSGAQIWYVDHTAREDARFAGTVLATKAKGVPRLTVG